MKYLDQLARGEISPPEPQDIAGHLDLTPIMARARDAHHEFSDDDLRKAFIQRRRLTLFSSMGRSG